jgi:hypothetical protein
MTVMVSENMHLDGQLLPFARDLREALGIYARRTWPLNASGHASQAWGIPKSTAANLLKGHASDATVTAILRAGGWPLALAVIGATIGQSFDDHLTQEREKLANERAHYAAREARIAALEDHIQERRSFSRARHREAAAPDGEPSS